MISKMKLVEKAEAEQAQMLADLELVAKGTKGEISQWPAPDQEYIRHHYRAVTMLRQKTR